MQVRFHAEAEAELIAAFDWYQQRSEQVAAAFAAELEHAIHRLRDAPMRWPPFQHGTRRVLLRRFPFGVIYRVGTEEIHVLAVAHLLRRPGYWRERTGQ